MKQIIFISLFFMSITLIAQKNNQIEEAQKFQSNLNDSFVNEEKSPLTKQDLKTFKALDFFSVDEDFIVTAKLKIFKNSKPFKMQTTSNRLPVYKIYGSATFKIKGIEYVLHIYQEQKLLLTNDLEDYLFLPFTDNTNAESTYGGGRYIDLRYPEGNTITIDFNRAYNPSCAYNIKYSCPVPPSTNHLNLEIKAGVKAFHKY